MRRSYIGPILLGLAALSCARQPSTPPPASTSGAPGAAAASAAPATSTPAQAGSQISGPVQETMDAASYTYVRVKTDNGDVWAAAPQFPVKVGERVTVPLEMPMKDFHSQSLNRDFPLIYFVSKIARDGETLSAGDASAAPPPTMMSGHGAGAASQPAASAVTEPIAQPAGGTAIAKLWADRKSLAGKTVTVRGRVVKFNGGILGHNWIHLQDGTGKATDNTNDITVMAGEDVNVKVGDTITVSGTVVLDKDIGSGYAYPTAIENARLVGKS